MILLGEDETILFVSTTRRFIKIKWIAIRRVRIDIMQSNAKFIVIIYYFGILLFSYVA